MNDLMNRNWQSAHFVIVQLRLDYDKNEHKKSQNETHETTAI